MKLVAKYFDELTTSELYEILKARAAIFVVEQNCAYQDLDDIDYKSMHVFYEEDGKVLAYLRIFQRESEQKTAQIGRVLTMTHGIGLGGKILHEAVRLTKENLHPERIYIEAQCYAVGFYQREGFEVCSDEFLEDGILHVEMVLEVKDTVQKGGNNV